MKKIIAIMFVLSVFILGSAMAADQVRDRGKEKEQKKDGSCTEMTESIDVEKKVASGNRSNKYFRPFTESELDTFISRRCNGNGQGKGSGDRDRKRDGSCLNL